LKTGLAIENEDTIPVIHTGVYLLLFFFIQGSSFELFAFIRTLYKMFKISL